MHQPTAYEQYMLELINRARSNPQAEAVRYGIDLNENLEPGRISSEPKQPLAFNPLLIDAARSHSEWMQDTGVFSFFGVDDNTPADRMRAAGYNFTGTFRWNESIVKTEMAGPLDLTEVVAQQHRDLFVDLNSPSRGHRVNMMNEDFREIGIGMVPNSFNEDSHTVITTQDFAKSASGPFLTGVVYQDLDNDKFYTPGEGLDEITVKVVRNSDGNVITTNSMDAGGYFLELAPGNYTVTFSDDTSDDRLLQNVTRRVEIADQNVKIDAIFDRDGNPIAPSRLIQGTEGDDTLTGTDDGDRIFGGAGNDNLSGDGGNDLLAGGEGRDTLAGGTGNDTLLGGDDRDVMFGGMGSDTFVVSQAQAATDISETDRIGDFEVGRDTIYLAGGLTVGDIDLDTVNNSTVLRVEDTDRILSVIVGLTPDQLNPNFTQSANS